VTGEEPGDDNRDGSRSSAGMMVRLLYILGLSAVAAGCAVLAVCVDQWRRDDPGLGPPVADPGVLEMFRARAGGQGADDGGRTASPLVVQAFVACVLSSAARVSEFGSGECGVSGWEVVRM
jgi:hypothetical protein